MASSWYGRGVNVWGALLDMVTSFVEAEEERYALRTGCVPAAYRGKSGPDLLLSLSREIVVRRYAETVRR